MKIKIADISVDVENYRHENVETERGAMQVLLRDEKQHKISDLAQDIIDQKGLDPSSLLIVAEDTANPGKYIALEGNRRMTALKTMLNPDLADGMPTHALFKKLGVQFLAIGLEEVECAVMDRAAAKEWIKRKHYKGIGGKGVVPWNAMATARSDRADGVFTRWMTALAFIELHGVDAEDLRDRISAKTTTVERVFSSSHMQTILGVTFKNNGTLIPESGDNAKAVVLMKSMLEEMGDSEFKETLVTNKDQQERYIRKFESLTVKVPAKSSSAGTGSGTTGGGSSSTNPASGSGSGTSSSTSGSASGTSPGSTASSAGTSSPGTKKSRPVRDRKYLADKGLRIGNGPLNRLYAELRRLNVESNRFSAGALLRVFLEKSTGYYLDAMSIPCANPNGWSDFSVKLRDKVKAVLHNLDPAGSKSEFQHAREVANGVRGKVHTLDLLNEAIHDHKYAYPSALELILAWDRLHAYYVALFEELEKNGK